LTLIENVVSATVLSLTLVVVVGLAPRALRAANHIEYRMQAHKLAQSVLEQHRSLKAAQLQPQTSLPLNVYALDMQGVQLLPELEILQLKPLTRELRVKVRWDEQGVAREVLHTVVVTELKR
jgi:type II secretory pathway pseudopilin PulG